MAINSRVAISFYYDEKNQSRTVEPYRIFIWKGIWYVIGKDVEKEEIRTFRLDRVNGNIKLSKATFDIPTDFRIEPYLPTDKNFEVTIQAPEGRCAVLRQMGEVTNSVGDSDEIVIRFSNHKSALGQILKYGEYAKVLSPKELANEVKKALKELADD